MCYAQSIVLSSDHILPKPIVNRAGKLVSSSIRPSFMAHFWPRSPGIWKFGLGAAQQLKHWGWPWKSGERGKQIIKRFWIGVEQTALNPIWKFLILRLELPNGLHIFAAYFLPKHLHGISDWWGSPHSQDCHLGLPPTLWANGGWDTCVQVGWWSKSTIGQASMINLKWGWFSIMVISRS